MIRLVVGLGNPGKEYERTRHNAGFWLVERFASAIGAHFRKDPKYQALVARMDAGPGGAGTPGAWLLLPQTFMNASGRSVRQIADFFHVEANDLLVVCDDINLPLGKLRFRARGTHGGHNGLRDIQNHLGITEYARLRIGVDSPDEDAVGHVLGKFRPSERVVIDDAVALAAQAVGVWVREGIEACMNRYNGDPDSVKKKKEQPKETKRQSDADPTV